ncbi:MAG: hypothetical protein U0Q16_38290 [Bryobacteraceae bacterium]
MTPIEQKKYRILVFGIEAKGLRAPERQIQTGHYELTFGTVKDAPRFQEFDGVVFFQGAFESFERTPNRFSTYLHHNWDRDALDRRTKEFHALTDAGGFAIILLDVAFINHDGSRDFSRTDLSKRVLLYYELRHSNFSGRTPHLRCHVDQLAQFFSLYGAATAEMSQYPCQFKTLASTIGDRVASLVVDRHVFVFQTLRPEAHQVEEYFTLLLDGVVALWGRLKLELPDWAKAFQFPDESKLLAKKRSLEEQAAAAGDDLARLDRFKRVFVGQGEPLVDAVIDLWKETLPLHPERKEVFREDLVLTDAQGKLVAFAEVKGVAKNVSREAVNQADSHRSRNEKPETFPSLLIVNTFMKNSKSIQDKDEAVPREQVEHAARNNVLILRTLDLLRLAARKMAGQIEDEEIVRLLTTSRGWLRVTDSTVEVLPEQA